MPVQEFQTKNQFIYEALKKAIIGGKYKPMERIVISEIAREFGSSDIPVREALKKLEADGLIHNKPYVGCRVASLNLDELEEIYQVRSELEGLATRLAAKRLNEGELEAMQAQIKEMEQAVAEGHYEQIGLLNREFHRRIYSSCGNEFLLKTIFELWDLTSRVQGIFAMTPERAHQSLTEHARILEALHKRNGRLAEALIVRQKEKTLMAMRRYLETQEGRWEGDGARERDRSGRKLKR
ncbi:MAG: GntR family transcriptional regulator [Thermodesulfobacteriota bacterium]